MRTFITFLSLCSLWLVSPTLAAGNGGDSDARECLLDHFADVSWALTPEQHWYFKPNGDLFILNFGSQDFRHATWSMDSQREDLILTLSFADGTAQRFVVLPSCDTFELEPLDMVCANLEFAKDTHNKGSRNLLTGEWQVGFADQATQYTFLTDGRFHATLTADGGYEVFTGHWTLAHDGTTLLLYTPTGVLEAFQIKYLALDEMVLAPMKAGGTLAPQAAGKDCFFNRL